MTDLLFQGLTPYLYYDDLHAATKWLGRVFGFTLIRSYVDENGVMTNAEMAVGGQELWLDGYPGYWANRGGSPDQWIGVWVNSADLMYRKVTSAGAACTPPVDRPHRVRELQVRDPQGYAWGFLERMNQTSGS